MIMKPKFLFASSCSLGLGLILLIAVDASGQAIPTPAPRALVIPAGGPATGASEKATALLEKIAGRSTTQRARVVAVDPQAFDADQVQFLPFANAEFVATRMNIGFTGTRYRSWTGRLPNGGSAAFIINGQRISGTITSPEGNFQFFPSGNAECVVVQHFPGQFPECAAGQVTPPPPAIGVTNQPAAPPNGDVIDSTNQPSSGDGNSGDTPTGNRIRVLVAYTPSAQSLTSSVQGQTMQELVDLAILESNQGYANSGVTMRLELACLYETVYNETTAIETDVARFRNSGDGFMDEVHTLRTDYDADMCCLMVDGTDTAWCGWAFGFDYTSYANMFQATVYSCATGNFTFAHEFGHNQGCRHDDDSTLTPFAYAHGFRNGNNWRTIMAVAGSSTAPRLNYWSNPNINSPVSPFTAMGTAVNGGNFANDNRTALNVGDNTVVNHEMTPANSVAPTGDTFNNDEGADKVVTGTLTVGTFNANNGSRVSFRAGASIVLTPGFRAAPGSEFRARITTPLGDTPGAGDTTQD
jgi:hypothetical protein